MAWTWVRESSEVLRRGARHCCSFFNYMRYVKQCSWTKGANFALCPPQLREGRSTHYCSTAAECGSKVGRSKIIARVREDAAIKAWSSTKKNAPVFSFASSRARSETNSVNGAGTVWSEALPHLG